MQTVYRPTRASAFGRAPTSSNSSSLSKLPSTKPLSVSVARPRGVILASIPRSTSRVSALNVSCSAGVAHPSEEASQGSTQNSLPIQMAAPATVMRGGGNMGSGSSLGMVLERAKVEFVMPTPPQRAPKLDDGGSGGDDGNHNRNGGGGGGDDGGDDDDYFGEGEGDGEGDGSGSGPLGVSLWRAALPAMYDKLSIAAVLQEWYRTIAELPLIIRRAVEMGLFSSAQLVRFLSMDCRPNATRTVSRFLPPTWARDFVGRLMADPAFVQKLVLEQTMMVCSSLYYEFTVRGENFQKELDLVLINTLGMAAATGAAVWVSAPTRSYGSVHKFPWQQMLSNLPNNIFDASGPLRQYSTTARAGGLLARTAEMSAIGVITGTVTSLLSQAAVALRQRSNPDFQPSVPVASVDRSAGGLGAFFAVNANLRYQLLGGLDQALFQHTNFLWTYVGATTVARLASNRFGELSRPQWQGLPDPAAVAAEQRAQQGKIRRVRRKRRTTSSTSSSTDPQLVAPVAAAAVVMAAGEEAAAPMVSVAAAEQAPAAVAYSVEEEAAPAAAVSSPEQQLVISSVNGEVRTLDLAATAEPLQVQELATVGAAAADSQ